MDNEFIYTIKNKVLTIEKAPDDCITYEMITDIVKDYDFNKVIIREGIDTICDKAFENTRGIKKVILPNSLKWIGEQAFNNCDGLMYINLNNGVRLIDDAAFKNCTSLKKVDISGVTYRIGRNAFKNCKNLRKVILEEGVESIGVDAFNGCEKLFNIKLPSSLTSIGNDAFDGCENLKRITIPEGVEEIKGCFDGCVSLKKVQLPSTLKVIGDSTFNICYSLRKLKLPNNLEKIGDNAFYKAGIRDIEIPSSVKSIGDGAFKYSELWDITFNEGLKTIGEDAFFSCDNLLGVTLPDSLEELGVKSFGSCNNLRNIDLSKGLKYIGADVVSRCYKLEKFVIPEGVTGVDYGAFHSCHKLEEIHFPSSLEYFFLNCGVYGLTKLEKLVFTCKDGEKTIKFMDNRFLDNAECKLFLYDYQDEKYSFFYKGEFVEFSRSLFFNNKAIKKMIDSEEIIERDFIKLYYWANRKIIPGAGVIKAMPIKDIDKFFVNKNCNEWAKLVKEAKYTYCHYVASFLKLCYVLGVFSESTNIRDKAVSFIRENIIGKMRGMDIHSKFDGFDLNNGFNEEYAEFFMKYYNDKDFMKYEDDVYNEIDLMAASYNNFKQVKKVYPNKTLHTNRKADLLLPEHVMNAVSLVEYSDVDDGNEEFAAVIGRYGYEQSQFEELQDWYNKAKNIKKGDMRLFISDDEEEKGITYKLLDKKDPMCAVLGNITNCCQVFDGAGEECVEYGMVKPNSGFITFNYKDKIIGQAWVWYDESSETICLDNIEVPHRYLEKIEHNKEIQKSFIECLNRIEKSFKKEMYLKGYAVNRVTIGKGYNDIKAILDKNYNTVVTTDKLSDYTGYSDARRQYEIKKKR